MISYNKLLKWYTQFLQDTGVLPDKDNSYTLYKSVKEDLTSFYDSKFKYKEKMRWSNRKLKADQSIECGEGCHFTNYWKAVEFAQGEKHTIISAQIKLSDILSVHSKVRVKAFSDVRIIRI